MDRSFYSDDDSNAEVIWGLGMKLSWSIPKHYAGIRLEGLRRKHENLRKVDGRLGQIPVDYLPKADLRRYCLSQRVLFVSNGGVYKKDGMGQTCNTHTGNEKWVRNSGWNILKGRVHLG
jgi:hypothetical protein